MNIANICFDADNKDRLIKLKERVVKATDVIHCLEEHHKKKHSNVRSDSDLLCQKTIEAFAITTLHPQSFY